MISPDSIAAFIAKWRASTLKERSAAQEHFIDLCRLLGVKTPAEEDPHGEWYCFEKGAKKTGGGDGWADVWKRGHFGWEYKGKGKSLRRPSDTWLIDFGNTLSESKAALYENPFEHVLLHVKPSRTQQRDEKRKTYWWRLGRSGAEIRSAIVAIPRYIATPMVAKHRLFVWLDKRVFPDQRLIIIARDDDTTFGILHSRLHELWSLVQHPENMLDNTDTVIQGTFGGHHGPPDHPDQPDAGTERPAAAPCPQPGNTPQFGAAYADDRPSG